MALAPVAAANPRTWVTDVVVSGTAGNSGSSSKLAGGAAAMVSIAVVVAAAGGMSGGGGAARSGRKAVRAETTASVRSSVVIKTLSATMGRLL
jgi:hypothetical protein